jgi:hypothetical protein
LEFFRDAILPMIFRMARQRSPSLRWTGQWERLKQGHGLGVAFGSSMAAVSGEPADTPTQCGKNGMFQRGANTASSEAISSEVLDGRVQDLNETVLIW